MTGKETCDVMKILRANVAKEYGIKGFEYKPCPNKDDCLGTCPVCDKETEALQKAIEEKFSNSKRKEWPKGMPDSLKCIMDPEVFEDMQYLFRYDSFFKTWDYHKTDFGRVIIHNDEKVQAEEKKRQERRNHRAMGYYVRPETDFEKLENDGLEKEEIVDNSVIGKIRGLIKKKK